MLFQVLFWDADVGDVSTAWVITNDPFLQQLFVEVLESLDEPRFVAYNLLRTRATLPVATSTEPEELVEEAASTPAPPRRKKARTQGPKVPEPEVDMSTLIECAEDEIVCLTYVPCINGILKTGSVVVYGGRDFRVDDLTFDGRRKKAFANLTAISDEVM